MLLLQLEFTWQIAPHFGLTTILRCAYYSTQGGAMKLQLKNIVDIPVEMVYPRIRKGAKNPRRQLHNAGGCEMRPTQG